MMAPAPCPKMWWVEQDALLAGCFPGDIDAAAAEAKLAALLDAGVRCFISLQEPGETGGGGKPFLPYAPALRRLAERRAQSVQLHNFPILDNGVTDAGTMRGILDCIDAAIASGACVYVHCWGGHGRTGTVVGCWLRERGHTGEEALKRIHTLRAHDPHLARNDSPQTPEQRQLICGWRPKG